MQDDIPRTVLLTWCAPNARFAGGEYFRKLLACFSADQLRWCCLRRIEGELPDGLPQVRSFDPPPVHWRLAGTTWEYLYVNELKSRRRATAIWEWLRPFRPELIWVLLELDGVSVVDHLRRLSGLPVHATVHDAHELASHSGVPPLYMPFYLRRLRRVLRSVSSYDAISDGLIDHLCRTHSGLSPDMSLRMPPSIGHKDMHGPVSRDALWTDSTRRIGLCGARRVSACQWRTFLKILGALPYDTTLVAFSAPDDAGEGNLPANVRIEQHPYAATEAAVVSALVAARVDACYVGLWNEESRRLFARTSLSSKLVTYAAVGAPIIVDGPSESVAWRLVSRYGAGVRLDAKDASGERGLATLLGDPDQWWARAQGASRMCREEFDLNVNAGHLAARFRQTVAAV